LQRNNPTAQQRNIPTALQHNVSTAQQHPKGTATQYFDGTATSPCHFAPVVVATSSSRLLPLLRQIANQSDAS
jgi:hypothetical protein